MGQHVKESAREGSAIVDPVEPVDETLSIVRQMLADEQSVAPKSSRPEPHAAPERTEPVVAQAGTAVKQRARGLDALPPLEGQEPTKAGAARAVTRRKSPERHPLSSPETRLQSLRRRFAGLFARRKVAAAPQSNGPVPDPKGHPVRTTVTPAPAATSELTLVQRMLKAVKDFRPTRKQIALFALLVVMVWRPWLIPGLVFVLFWVGLIAYLTIGPDRIAEICAARWDWFQQRHPERAATLQGKVQRGADRVDGWLARLPESWTDGIYLPDFGRSAAQGGALDDQPDPFDRLAAEQKAVSGHTG